MQPHHHQDRCRRRPTASQRRTRLGSNNTPTSSVLYMATVLATILSIARASNERSDLDGTSCFRPETAAPTRRGTHHDAVGGQLLANDSNNGYHDASGGASRREAAFCDTQIDVVGDATSFPVAPRTDHDNPGNASVSFPPAFPERWNPPRDHQKMTYRQLWDLYGCDSDATYLGNYYGTSSHPAYPKRKQHQQQRPIPTPETWLFLRKVYNRVVRQHLCRDDDDAEKNDAVLDSDSGNDDSSVPTCYVEGVDVNTVDDADNHGSSSTTTRNASAAGLSEGLKPYPSGFRVAVEVRYSPGKGRGLFALEDVPNGALVWVSQYEGWMRSGRLYRLLLEALPTDAWRCDVMTFSYYTVRDDDDPVDPDSGEPSDGEDHTDTPDAQCDGEDCEGDDGTDDGDEPEDHDEKLQVAERLAATEILKANANAEREGMERRQTAVTSHDRMVETEGDDYADEGEEENEGEDEEWEKWDDDDDDDDYDDDYDADYDDDYDNMNDDESSPSILVDLDEAALMNADWESSDGRKNINVGLYADDDDDGGDGSNVAERDEGEFDHDNGDGLSRYVALRDIRAGEEILCAYHDFVRDDKGWAKVGL